jgi:hypothetical protein
MTEDSEWFLYKTRRLFGARAQKRMHGVNAQKVGDSGHRRLIGSHCWSCGCGFGHVRMEAELLALGINAAQVLRNSAVQSSMGGHGGGRNDVSLERIGA